MNSSPKYEIPWDLIADALTGNLSRDGDYELQQWLLSDPENKKKFLKIQELWKDKAEDYRYFRQADAGEAWKALQVRMKSDEPGIAKAKVIQVDFSRRKKFIRNLLAVASVCIGFIAIIWYLTLRNNTEIYMTDAKEEKKITLTDGSVIILQPLTRIEVSGDFESRRTVFMSSGEADFEVVHRTGKPFIVKLGSTIVRDIGTRFIIRREDKFIHVAVSNGKVALIRTANNETRELEAGSSVSFDEQKKEFSSIIPIEQSAAFEEMLVFENTPLSEVIRSLQAVYGKKVEITNDISSKRLTAKLHGMSFNRAIEVICTSLDLEYALNDSIYMIKAKGNNNMNSLPE